MDNKKDDEPRLNYEEFFELTGHELTGRLDGLSVHKYDDKIIAIIEMLEEEEKNKKWL